MVDYLYDMLESFYEGSEDALIIYQENLIKYQNNAFRELTGSRLCMASVCESLGVELAYRVKNMLKDHRMCGINKCLVAGKLCKVRANKCGNDTVMVIHVINNYEKRAEETQFALDSIFGIASEQNDVIMTASLAVDVANKKNENNETVKSYLDSASKMCLLAAKHNGTIRELSLSAERNIDSCNTDRAINTVIKMCDILIGKTRMELSYHECELCMVACNVYELENIIYSIIAQLLRENPKPGKIEITAENEKNSVKITIEAKKVLWDKNAGGTDILRAENRIRVCGGKFTIADGNKIILDMPKGKSQLTLRASTDECPDIKRGLIELCEVI